MRNVYFLVFGLFMALSVKAQDLLITGVYDGPLSGGNPKGVELYVINDIPDLSVYGIGSANNGGGSDGEEFTFSGSATAGDFIYVASPSNGGEAGFNSWFGFAPDFLTTAVGINGDDAVELFMNGTVIDLFGDIDVDGSGEVWEYTDGWAYRTSGGPSAMFDPSGWAYSGSNAFDGETSNGTAANPFPAGTFDPSLLSVSSIAIQENSVKIATTANTLVIQGMEVASVEIYDINGRLVGNSTNLSGLSRGVYIARIVDANGQTVSKKFVK